MEQSGPFFVSIYKYDILMRKAFIYLNFCCLLVLMQLQFFIFWLRILILHTILIFSHVAEFNYHNILLCTTLFNKSVFSGVDLRTMLRARLLHWKGKYRQGFVTCWVWFLEFDGPNGHLTKCVLGIAFKQIFFCGFGQFFGISAHCDRPEALCWGLLPLWPVLT